MSIINNGLLLASGADAATTYQISRSLRFNSADSAYLERVASSAGDRAKWTLSFWIKRTKLGTSQDIFSAGTSGTDILYFTSGDALALDRPGATVLTTTQVFRDVSAWYHIVLAVDAANGTNSNKAKLYVNGSEITAFSTDNRSGVGSTSFLTNTATTHRIGVRSSNNTVNPCDMYLADVYLLDGTTTDPSTFAETDAVTGQWAPKTPTGISYGTNGFRLTFSDNSGTTSTTLGKDAAGSNNWSPNYFSVASGSGNDSLVDSPTSYGTDAQNGGEVRGNYCVLNPLDSGGGTLSNGNLEHTYTSSYIRVRSTISIPETGKWYAEFVASNTGGGNSLVGVSTGTNALTGTNWYLGSDADSWGCQIGSGTMYTYHAGGYSSFGTAASGDVISVAVDRAAGKIWWAVNNTWIGSGNPASGTNARYTDIPATGALFFAISNQNSSSIVCNFGQRAFAYTAPSGFKALCDTNLTAPTIALPNTVMDVKLYTGTAATQSITGLGFSPDFVWIKNRNGTAAHHVFDIVRGATKRLITNGTQDDSYNAYDSLTSFDTSGFTLGADTSTGCVNNPSGATYAAWCWDAGSSTTTNYQPSGATIAASVRANATAGFSIVTYTGTGSNATVGHGLNVAPSFYVVKDRSSAYGWPAYHSSLSSATKYLLLNDVDASITGANVWNSIAPTSTVFSIGTAAGVNTNGDNYVAYCFAPVAGYSSAFSVSGNGSTNGPFCHLGFRPRLIIYKRTDTSGDNWFLHDTARDTYNVLTGRLFPNTSGAESTNINVMDVLSNGFKLRTDDSSWNASGGTYIGFAWAESPFQYARAR